MADVDPEWVLETLEGLTISEWTYLEELDEGVRRIGPMSQDFYEAFGYGFDETGIGTVDADGVAMASIQALAQRNGRLQDEVDDLRARLARLEALIEKAGLE